MSLALNNPDSYLIARRLTEDELRHIIAVIPYDSIKAVDQLNRDLLYESIINEIYMGIKFLLVVPNAIEMIRALTYKRYMQSLLESGTLIGTTVANSFSQPLMQMVLNAFHTSGNIAQGVSAGYHLIRSILLVSPNIEYPTIRVMFKNHLSLSETVSFREKYIGITVDSLLVKSDPEAFNGIIDENYNIWGSNTMPYWYHNNELIYRLDLNKLVRPNSYILRLTIDVQKLFKYRVNIEYIYHAISTYNYTYTNPVAVVVSPIITLANRTKTMYVDIIPNVDTIINKSTYDPVLIGEQKIIRNFLYEAVYKNLKLMQVQGLKTISDLFLNKTNVWAYIQYIIRAGDNRWLLYANIPIIAQFGITKQEIINFLEFMQIRVINITDKYIEVESAENPKAIYTRYSKADVANKEEYERERRLELIENYGNTIGRSLLRPPSAYENLAVKNYLSLNGSNMVSLYYVDEIDHNLLMSNNISEIFELYGIEAVRNYIIIILNRLIADNSQSLDPHNIIVIADFMTHLGIITNYTFSGLAQLKINTIDKALFQQAVNTLANNAATGETNAVNTVTSQILIGIHNDSNRKKLSEKDEADFNLRYGYETKAALTATAINDIAEDDLPIEFDNLNIFQDEGLDEASQDLLATNLELERLFSDAKNVTVSEIKEPASTSLSALAQLPTAAALPTSAAVQPLLGGPKSRITISRPTATLGIMRPVEAVPSNLWTTSTLYANYRLEIA